MLAVLLTTCIACSVPQGPQYVEHAAMASAVMVRGDAELSPAEALASAEQRVDEHVRSVWSDRAERAVGRYRPFWMPEFVTAQAVQRWLADLPIERMVQRVDREDRERTHEFGNSYQTTLWIAEDRTAVERNEHVLRNRLRRLERQTAMRAGGVAAGWVMLALLLAWIDRLSRGYMTGRLRAIGVLAGLLMPAVAILV